MGGINLVLDGHRGEWRAIGIETAIQNEFGNYLKFRKSLPDTAANIIFRKKLTAATGLYTDMIWKSRHHVVYGFKFAGGLILNSQSSYSKMEAKNIFPLTYFSPTFHMTKKNLTAFIQSNFGTYADSFQIGLNYKLGRN